MPFSTAFAASVSPASVFAHSTPAVMRREARNSAHSVSSLTPLAFAPGVLKTTMPSSEQRSTGMLLTPAPQRAMASRLSSNVMSCMAAERTMTASGDPTSVPTS